MSRMPERPLILVADDNTDTREMYALYLNMVGYNVETAQDGHEAVITARMLHPDVIVMDLQMPRLDGWAAIRELQRSTDTATIPIVALTGHDLKAFLKPAALAVGAASFLMKPCVPEQLAREISARLAASRNRSASAL